MINCFRFMVSIGIFFVCAIGIIANEEKIIEVPSEMAIEIVVADDQGLLNGVYDVRARLFLRDSYERLWYEDFGSVSIIDGAFVLMMNTDSLINAYEFHHDDIVFVVTVGNQTVEFPLLTDFYSYRSLFSEFGYAMRFPRVFYVDRTNGFIGIGTMTPDNYLDVNGAMKIGYEDTVVTGSIRWRNDTLEVKRGDAEGWIDLAYNPENFNYSKWSGYDESIQLTTPNYKVGIGVDPATNQFEVNGNGYFSRNLTAANILADGFVINNVQLSDETFVVESLEFSENSQEMIWTSQNILVNYGVVSGDGTNLTNIGEITIDFKDDMITNSKISENTIASRNLTFDSISTELITSYNILQEKFVKKIFNSDHFADDSIGSDNIMTESLSFDILSEDIYLLDYIPDLFFTSDHFSDDSIYNFHIQDSSISSLNVSGAIFSSNHFSNSVVISEHIASESITLSKLTVDAITVDLFSGIAGLSAGGTGVDSLDSGYVVVLEDDHLSTDHLLSYSDVSFNVGIDELNSDVRLMVNHSTGSAFVVLEDQDNRELSFQLSNSDEDFFISVGDDGFLSFELGSSSYHISTNNVFGVAPTVDDEQLKLGVAITIGNSDNSDPDPGTIEYNDEDEFRFYDGSSWIIVSDLSDGYGIGAPILAGKNQMDVDETFIAEVHDSDIQLSKSSLVYSEGSIINGKHFSIGESYDSNLNGTLFNISVVSDSKVFGDNIIGRDIDRSIIEGDHLNVSFVDDASLYGARSTFHHIERSVVNGQNMGVEFLQDSVVFLNEGRVQYSDHSKIHSNYSTIHSFSQSTFHGDYAYINGVINSEVYGDGNAMMGVSDSMISGDESTFLDVHSFVQVGDNNYVFFADSGSVHGQNNRLIGSNNIVRGDSNVVFGNGSTIESNGAIVFNASSVDGVNVDIDDQVVFNAPNGVHISTGPGMIVSATESAGGWTMVSDRNLKTSFHQVDQKEIFDRLMGLKIHRWEYIFNEGIQHIGPMAQDFGHKFDVGEDDRFITTSDSDGVAFSAIQYLIQEIDRVQNQSLVLDSYSMTQFDDLLEHAIGTVDQLEVSAKMKISSLKFLMDNNAEQYQLIDKQFKVLSRIKSVPEFDVLLRDSIFLVFIYVISGIVGFFGLKRYYNRKG